MALVLDLVMVPYPYWSYPSWYTTPGTPPPTTLLHAEAVAVHGLGTKECYGLEMGPKPVSNGPILTFRTDYLPFGLVYSPMLQESTVSKGPRVPRSILSM